MTVIMIVVMTGQKDLSICLSCRPKSMLDEVLMDLLKWAELTGLMINWILF